MPLAFKKLSGFNIAMARQHFRVAPEHPGANEVYLHDDVAELPLSPESNSDFESPPCTAVHRKFYKLEEMLLLEDLREIHKGKSLNSVIDIAKGQLPQIFLRRTKFDTFKGFAASIQKIRDAEEAKAAKKAKRRQLRKERREKRKLRARQATDCGGELHPLMDEKRVEVEEAFAAAQPGKGNNTVMPREVCIGVAMVLFSQYVAGVPLTCSLALPIIIGYIRAKGHSDLLHSKQTSVPLQGTMRSNKIEREAGKVYWTKRAVNSFFQRIGLSESDFQSQTPTESDSATV